MFFQIKDEKQLPNVPNRICKECKKSILQFYTLKKTYEENEAVLLGTSVESAEERKKKFIAKQSLLPMLDEFLSEHVNDALEVTKLPDKLVINIGK